LEENFIESTFSRHEFGSGLLFINEVKSES